MNIIITKYFKKQIKPQLKKHRGLINDVIIELKKFDKNTAINIGRNVYKTRLKSSNLNKGKRNAFRLIILLVEANDFLAPITIYFKGEKENISKKEITEHEKIVIAEMKQL